MLVLGLGVTGFLVLVKDDGGRDDTGRERTVKVTRAALGFGNGLSILSEPGRTWSLSAADATEDGRGEYFSSPFSYGDGESFAPRVIGDTALILVGNQSATDESDYVNTLVAVDASTGNVRWRQDAHDYANCVAVADPTKVVCSFAREDQPTEVKLLDLGSGDEQASYSDDAEGWALMLGTGGDSVYLARYEYEGGGLTVARLRASDLGEVWQKSYGSQGDPDAEGAGVKVAGGRVLVWVGINEWVLDTATGTLIAEDGGDTQLLTNGYAVNYHYDDAGSSATIEDYEGFAIAQLPQYPWFGAGTGTDYVNHGTVGAGNTLFSLSDNSPLWTREDYPTDASFSWTPDRRNVIAPNVDYDQFEYLDAEDGSTLWTLDASPHGAWTEDGFLYLLDGRLEVVDREDGDTAWSQRFEYDTDEEYGEIAVAGSSVVVANPAYLTGYTDFGTEPGSSSDDGDADGAEDPAYTTACGSEPVFTPTTAVDEGGGITVTVTMHAVCPSGQWLHSAGQMISVTDGSVTYASARFDFSGTPYWVPGSEDEPTTLRLTFPYENSSGSAAEVQDGINRKVIVVPCETDPDAYLGPVPDNPDDGTDPSLAAYPSGPAEAVDDAEENALAALKRLAAADSAALEPLAGKWVPQLASQKLGRPANATYASILAEHLRLRGRYPEVKLLWSGDWTSFSGPDFWVSVVSAKASAAWRPALRWCPSQGLDDAHCYAKNLNHTGTSEKATKHQANLYR